jgi:hypothetical protein
MKLGSKVKVLVGLAGLAAIVGVNSIVASKALAISLAECEIVYGNSVTRAGRMMYQRCMDDALNGQRSSPSPSPAPVEPNASDVHGLAQLLPSLYSQGTDLGNGVRVHSSRGSDSSMYVTNQRADDGSLMYYGRINSDRTLIIRYNSSNQSAGYTEIWEYVTRGPRSGYLHCRVNIVSKNGRLLDKPEQTVVETNDMYDAIAVLLR